MNNNWIQELVEIVAANGDKLKAQAELKAKQQEPPEETLDPGLAAALENEWDKSGKATYALHPISPELAKALDAYPSSGWANAVVNKIASEHTQQQVWTDAYTTMAKGNTITESTNSGQSIMFSGKGWDIGTSEPVKAASPKAPTKKPKNMAEYYRMRDAEQQKPAEVYTPSAVTPEQIAINKKNWEDAKNYKAFVAYKILGKPCSKAAYEFYMATGYLDQLVHVMFKGAPYLITEEESKWQTVSE